VIYLGALPTDDPNPTSLANVGRVVSLVRRRADLTGIGRDLLVDIDGRDQQVWPLSIRDGPISLAAFENVTEADPR
jgi:hypothetical protein